jgi:hypothetical protein
VAGGVGKKQHKAAVLQPRETKVLISTVASPSRTCVESLADTTYCR